MIFTIILVFNQINAQNIFYRDDSVKVFIGNQPLLNPWAGGLNATEFSNIDLNFDGKKDLVAFDKESGKIRCFLFIGTNGNSNYKHAPQYESFFPKVNDWCILADYNSDGKEDIFTYTSGGMKVYKNTSSTTGSLQFSLTYSLVYSNYNPGGAPNMLNLYCSPVGFPGISDIDNDGDLDVLTFSVFGTMVEYHRNRAIEDGFPLDSLKFVLEDNCWGNFAENTCATTLNNCPNFIKWNEVVNGKKSSSNLHAGSCLTCLDNDGDGDKDLILGDISCDSIEFFYNTGSIGNSFVDSTTKKYPDSKPIKIAYFPCTYYVETDNDGSRDLIVSPHSSTASENFTSTWLYKNTGTDNNPIFSFSKLNFLQDSMLDFGTGAYPTLIDENADGKLDIMIGNYGYYLNPLYQSRIALLRNTGTITQPEFKLITRNYANLSSFNIQNMAPAFGDLDGDGDRDLLIGDFNGTLTYFQNVAGSGNPMNLQFASSNWNNIDVGNNAMPQIIDVDRDGLRDLLIGARNGKIHFYKNTGTSTNPMFSATPVSNFFGGVNVCQPLYITGFAAPNLRDVDGTYELLVGSERGFLYRYGNIDGNLSGNFTLIDSIGWNIWEGGKIAPACGDLNGDDVSDMILGNLDGGICFFKGDSLMSSVDDVIIMKNNFSVYPNPANEILNIKFSDKTFTERKIEIIDFSSRMIKSIKTVQPVIEIKTQDISDGIYIIRSTEKNHYGSQITIIKH
jgi:hypothetical protein